VDEPGRSIMPRTRPCCTSIRLFHYATIPTFAFMLASSFPRFDDLVKIKNSESFDARRDFQVQAKTSWCGFPESTEEPCISNKRIKSQTISTSFKPGSA
jgi:hypothetical protein